MLPQVARLSLQDFLIRAFSSDELRNDLQARFGETLTAKLPSPSVSHEALCHATIEALCRLGLVDAEYFHGLRAARPLQLAEIEAIAAPLVGAETYLLELVQDGRVTSRACATVVARDWIVTTFSAVGDRDARCFRHQSGASRGCTYRIVVPELPPISVTPRHFDWQSNLALLRLERPVELPPSVSAGPPQAPSVVCGAGFGRHATDDPRRRGVLGEIRPAANAQVRSALLAARMNGAEDLLEGTAVFTGGMRRTLVGIVTEVHPECVWVSPTATIQRLLRYTDPEPILEHIRTALAPLYPAVDVLRELREKIGWLFEPVRPETCRVAPSAIVSRRGD